MGIDHRCLRILSALGVLEQLGLFSFEAEMFQAN